LKNISKTTYSQLHHTTLIVGVNAMRPWLFDVLLNAIWPGILFHLPLATENSTQQWKNDE